MESVMGVDEQLQRDVIAQLDWEPSVNAAQIGVEVSNGVVTLAGHVGSFAEKWEAEQLVLRMSGIKALAMELDVTLPGASRRLDADIAQAAENALAWLTAVPTARVHVMVEGGWLSLSGDVDWHYQRLAAALAVRFLMGVRGVSDTIAILPKVALTALKSEIEGALARNAQLGAKQIAVRIDGAELTLSGTVASWAEREVARHAAWGTPGVRNVIDDMRIAF
jgi:osmotically-inducible protein OsmY